MTAGIADPLVFRQVMDTLIDQVDDGVLVAEASGRVLYHNAAVRELFGLDPGTDLRELRQLGTFRWNRRSRKASDPGVGGAAQRYEERITIGEMRRYLAFTVRRVGLAAGVGEIRVVVVRDVTQQRQIEATLEESRACGLITANAEMLNLIERARQVARSDAAVLLQGESGVGKTCFARLIHEHSSRASGPMVEVNCAAIPEALFEAEFFGTRRAGENREGKFVAAQGGTLFLDEIGEIPVHIQAKLLTVLEEKRFRRPGGEIVRVDARIISASNADLRRAVDGGQFRPELYYRIGVIPLRIPPLRERIGDIPVLVQHFCDNLLAKTHVDSMHIARDAWQALLNYPWPGNIRELANAVEHGFICAEQGEVKLDSLPQDVRLFSQEPPAPPADGAAVTAGDASGAQGELLSALRRAHGSKAVAAKLLGIDRTTLWRRMQRMRLS